MNTNPPNAPSLRRFALEERYESLIIKPPTDKCCDNDNCESSNVNPPPAPNPKYKRNNSNNDVKNEHIQECIIV